MRDANLVKGTHINFMDENWVLGEVYYVPGNPTLYVELKKKGITMNVILDEVKYLITNEKMVEVDI